MILIAIDPGTESSGVVIYDGKKVIASYKDFENNDLVEQLRTDSWACKHLAIEMVASYGMAVGKTTFETVYWIGRFVQAFGVHDSTRIYRKDVKMFLCNSMKAKDANVRQAILDRFEPSGGGKTPQVGTKKEPGPLFGVSSHAWSALAIALTYFGD